MPFNLIPYLSQVASFLHVQPGKLILEDDIPVRITSKDKQKGFLNIIITFLNESNRIDLIGTEICEQTEIRQWIEYSIVYAVHNETTTNANQILSELDSIFRTRTYLVSDKLTIADVILYYILIKLMQNLSNLEKEKYVNVSRWFDNIQQDAKIRQKNTLIDFSTNFLVSLVPARN